MRQKEHAPGSAAPESSLHGNPEAAAVAAKAREALAIEVKPDESWRGFLEGKKMLPDRNGNDPDELVTEFIDMDDIEGSIGHGFIDPATMRWTDKARAAHQDGWICYCLVPCCAIGPFIPVRR